MFEEWFRTGEKRPRIQLDAFVVMPNHIHGIIIITDADENKPPRAGASVTGLYPEAMLAAGNGGLSLYVYV